VALDKPRCGGSAMFKTKFACFQLKSDPEKSMRFVVWGRGRRQGARLKGQALLLCALIALLLPGNADARRRHYREAYSPASSAMAIDLHTGRVLYSKNANEPRYPASITKVMTLYLLFDALRDGKLTMQTKLRVSERAADQSPTKLGLSAGDTIQVADAIGAIVTKSANDMAVTVAEALAGSEEEFARRMTQKARTIGMVNTTFRNASGLPNPDQQTTAHDLIVLGKSILADHPERARVFATKYYQYDGEVFRNHNTMLFSYEGMEGMKTGFTSASGFNLLASARRGEKRLLAVVLGGSSAGSRNAAMRNILDASWSKALTQTAARKAGVLASTQKAKAPEPAPHAKPKPFETASVDKPKQFETASVQKPEREEARPKPKTAALLGRMPDRTSIAMIIASIERGLAKPSLVSPRPETAAQQDATTDEAEEEAQRAEIQSAAHTPPRINEIARNETLVTEIQTPRAQNVSVHFKTVVMTEVEPLDAVALEGLPVESKPHRERQSAKAQSAARASEPEAPRPAEPQPQTVAPAASAPAVSHDTDQPGPFHVQVGAFPNQEEARARLANVKAALGPAEMRAHPEFIMPVALPTGVTMFRARLSRFASEAQAKSACKQLKRSGIECWDIRAQ
jgi:D-alanyl-D-alanine carboxypeptidase